MSPEAAAELEEDEARESFGSGSDEDHGDVPPGGDFS